MKRYIYNAIINKTAIYSCFCHWHDFCAHCCENENNKSTKGVLKWRSNIKGEIHGTMVTGKEFENQKHTHVLFTDVHIK